MPFVGDYVDINDSRVKSKDGYAVFSAVRPTAQTAVALVEEVGKDVLVDGATVRVLRADQGTATTSLPPSLLLSPLLVTDFRKTIFVAKGAPHAFLAQSIELDGQPTAAEHRFSQTGTVAYEAIGIPKTMAVQHATFAGVYDHSPAPYQPFLYTLGGKSLYLYKAGQEGGQWRFCDNGMAATAANPRHPNYGKHSTPFTEHLDDPFMAGTHGPSPRLPSTAGPSWSWTPRHRTAKESNRPWSGPRAWSTPPCGPSSSKTASSPLTSRTTRVPPTSFHRR